MYPHWSTPPPPSILGSTSKSSQNETLSLWGKKKKTLFVSLPSPWQTLFYCSTLFNKDLPSSSSSHGRLCKLRSHVRSTVCSPSLATYCFISLISPLCRSCTIVAWHRALYVYHPLDLSRHSAGPSPSLYLCLIWA